MELCVKIVHSFMSLTFFVQTAILDARLGSEYAFADSKSLLTFSKNKAAQLFAN